MSELAMASARRIEASENESIDDAILTLLARYEAVTSDPRKMHYLRSLLRHYAKSSTPWRDCVRDNTKRFGPKTPGLCGVLKDTIRQSTHWRHGAPAGPHADHPDFGSPGVDIANSDMKLSAEAEVVWRTLLDISEQCDTCRVLLGLDVAPSPSVTFLSEYVEAAA
jgi:hypothetical protein